MKKRTTRRASRSPRTRRTPSGTVGDRIIAGLTELRDALHRDPPLAERFTARTVSVPEPERFTAQRTRAVRQRLGVSQGVFAKMVGVSTILAQSWEQGVRIPSPLACRLLAEIEHNPQRWRRMLNGGSGPRRKSA